MEKADWREKCSPLIALGIVLQGFHSRRGVTAVWFSFMAKEREYSPLFILVTMIAVVAALAFAKEILLPIALAMLLSFLLTPVANWLERWGVPRVLSVVLVVAMAFAPLGLVGWIVTQQSLALSDALPIYRERIVRNVTEKIRAIRPSSDTLNTVSETIEDVSNKLTDEEEGTDQRSPGEAADELNSGQEYGATSSREADEDDSSNATDNIATAAPIDDDLDAALPDEESVKKSNSDQQDGKVDDDAVPVTVVNEESRLTQVGDWLGWLAPPLATAGLVIVLVFFLLLDRESQRNRLIQLFGKSNLHSTTEAFHDAAQRVGRYLRMLFLINTGYGVAVTLGLWMIGVPSAITWGVLGFMLRFLPYLGPWLAAGMPLVVSFAVTEGWSQPLMVMGMYIVYELILNNVAEPLLYGSSVGVSTVGVVLSAIFWTWLWGPIGLILAMPMTVCLVVFTRYVPQLRFINVLLADQPPLTPPERVYQRLLAFDYEEPMKLARTHLKTAPLEQFYDEVLIPALVLAERDRHAGLLNEDQERFLQEAAADLVDDVREIANKLGVATGEEPATAPAPSGGRPAAEGPKARVLCMPLRDDADETTAKMLAHLIEAEGLDVTAEPADLLTSEMVDRVAMTASDVVVISILPPIAPRDSRLLWKRLRARYPDLPIIVGFWNCPANQRPMPPDEDEATKVACTLSEAVALVRVAVAQVALSEQPHVEPPLRGAAG
jgi:predicted PurR-regulated permease PerM